MRKLTLQQIHIRQETIMRKRRKANRKRKAIHKRRKKSNPAPAKIKSQTPVQRPLEVKAPADFSIDNLEKVLTFVNDTERDCTTSNVRILKVNLNNVEKIDSYAISLLLSMLNRLSYKNINYWGTYPDSPTAKDFIIESGFLDVMKTNIKRPSNRQTGNRIFMVGKDSVDSHRIGKAVRESMEFVTGKKQAFPPVYDDMLEISANSVEHANKKRQEKNWLVSISQEGDKVHFILTDTGLGILATLKRKGPQKFKDALTIKSDAEILYNVFNKAYQSATGEINRYKGLPIILESFTEGFVSELKVVTNKVFYDFTSNQSKELRYGFKGVLYSWTVSKNNYDNWINSL